jgi:long-subunit acyl-CoA synthetase (AMP-forming)
MIAGAAPSSTLIQGLEKLNISVLHVYGLTETYGPFTSCVEMPEWQNLDAAEYYKLKAMQGFAYVTSDSVRVIRQGSSAKDGFQDVAKDGKEMGEIIVRGNMSMKEYYNDPDATGELES